MNDYGFGLIPQPRKPHSPTSFSTYPLDEQLLTLHLLKAVKMLWPTGDADILESGTWNKPSVVFENDQLSINLRRCFYQGGPAYEITKRWLLADPRTTSDSMALNLENTIISDGVQYNFSIVVFLDNEDLEALRAAGLLKKEHISYTTENLHCSI